MGRFSKQLAGALVAIVLVILFAFLTWIVTGAPLLRVDRVNSPGYSITTDNRQTRSGLPVTCFVLRDVDGRPVDLSCVSDEPPLQLIPWEGPESGTRGNDGKFQW